jgi:hypothetical protein
MRWKGSGEDSSLGCLLLTKHYLGDQIEKLEIGRHVAHMVDRRGVYRVLVGRHEGKRPLGRGGCR